MADQDLGRRQVAARGLTAAAVDALIPMMGAVGFEELGLVKALLKRFFSAEAWTAMDASALADAVGPPPAPSAGGDVDVVRRRLGEGLDLVAGLVDGRFVIDVERDGVAPSSGEPLAAVPDLGSTFASDVVPQPTPNPRTIRFATGHRAQWPSVGFRRDDAPVDDRVAAVFALDTDIVDVLVAADFVAVTIVHPSRWPALLPAVLDAVAARFAGGPTPVDADDGRTPAGPDVRGVAAGQGRASAPARTRRTRLDRAWADLGRLDARRPADLADLLAATGDPDGARRQVAAQLLDVGPEEAAARAWSAMLDDPSRAVRRAVVDAVAGAGRPALRPLLERACADADGWIRWKALRGLVDLGAEPSRTVVEALADDPDFRVRLEAEHALPR